jgi:hypothetical protein
MEIGKLWQDKGMQKLAWRTEASLRILIKMPGLFSKYGKVKGCIW